MEVVLCASSLVTRVNVPEIVDLSGFYLGLDRV